MSASSTAFAASTTRACRIRSARRSRTASRPALRLLDEHCRVYQYLLKRTVGPFVAAPCAAADRERGDPASGGVPERPPARPLRPVALPGAALRGAARRATKHGASPASGRRPREALRAWLSTDQALCSSSSRSWTEPSGRCTTRRRRSRSRSATSVPRACEKPDGVPLLPRARELRPGRRRRRAAHARHTPRLLRLGLGHRLPPRSPRWSATASSRCCR